MKLQIEVHYPDEKMPPPLLNVLIILNNGREIIGHYIGDDEWHSDLIGDIKTFDRGIFATESVYAWGSFNQRQYVHG